MIAHLLRGLIWLYRHSFSFFWGNTCRFVPSCSVYADEALRRYGAVRGLCLAVWRILRCNPWGGSGYDPVPDQEWTAPFSRKARPDTKRPEEEN